jgi:asparagine synthase (glutamine-hydrolysing)
MNTPGDRAHKLANLMRSRDQWDLYWKLTSIVQEPASLLADGAEPRSPLTDPAWLADGEDFEARMMQADVVSYLVDDIMTKVDRASMAVSLEAREPYLDHRLVELAFRLPTHLKVRDGETKWILRQVLHQRVPRRLFERPKMGFSIPIERWLAGPLRDWAEHLLSPAALARDGLWRPDAVRALWHEHLSGQRMVHHQLWVILMFQAWAERWQGEPTAS